MQLRYPFETELHRDGFDEGVGHGFDDLDTSPLASRSIATPDSATSVLDWFVDALGALGWTHEGDGRLQGNRREWIFIRVERDRGLSGVAAMIQDATARSLQEEFEREYYRSALAAWSVVTIFYGVSVR